MKPPSTRRKAAMMEAAEHYAQFLPMAEDYLATKRGLSVAEAEPYLLGYVEVPVDRDEPFQGRLSIPYLTPTGCVGLKYRCVQDHDCEGHPKYLYQPGSAATLYNVNALHRESSVIALTEGECFPPDAEILTPEGWVSLADYDDQDVAQYHPQTGALTFTKPTARIERDYVGDLVTLEQKSYHSTTTPGHRIPAFGGKRDPLRYVTAEEGHCNGQIPRAGTLTGPGLGLNDSLWRLMVAVSADGTIDVRKDGSQYIRMSFSRGRKIERIRGLLADLGWSHTDTHPAASPSMTSICFKVPDGVTFFKEFPQSWLVDATAEERREILDELVLWDGNQVPNRTMTEYSSKLRHNAEWVQTLCHTAGVCSTIVERRNAHGEWFKVTILNGKTYTTWQQMRTSRKSYEGKVYCVQMPSGAILVRQAGHIAVSGNCDAISVEVHTSIPAVGYPGVDTWRKNGHWNRCFDGYNTVFIISDGDKPGRDAASKILSGLDNGIIVAMPDGHDSTSFIMEYGAEEMLSRFGYDTEEPDDD